ncbi:hypothetical protein [Nocardiopsis tropica]|uniref:Uncharacterized protein n=1 Tax=Nocardiopsis tropica TaxID=109330 RepID=A0ABU7L122_9ACTN|nr:hypothetical protein [Nocardiopsis umidischolae]MEE2055260.1 hypothetical protein [Nocardiopsis umidischolae]
MIDFVLQPTQEGELRRRVLFWLPAPLPVLGAVYLLVGGALSAAGWTILLAASVGVGTLLLAFIVQPTPLPEGLVPQVSARRSLHRFRQFTGLRIALALVPVAIGAAASVVGGGMYPLLASLLLAWPQLLLAMPTFFTITRARRAMEAWGTTAYLWHALSRPAKVTWPIVTPLVNSWKAARVARSRESMRQKLEERAWKKAVREESSGTPDGAAPAAASADERTRPIRPLDTPSDERTDVLPHLASPSHGGEEPTDVLPHLEAGRTGREKPTDVLPHLPSGQEVEPTRQLPHLGGAGTGEEGSEPGPGSGSAADGDPDPDAPAGPRSSVHRAARQFFEQGGGALGIAVRRSRRAAPSTRRPHSNKP